MGKGTELLALLKTGNSSEARKTITKLKKQGKKKILAVLNEQDEEGCTPLHYSAAYNFLDFIEDFLELGSVVDVEDNKGYTPLHLAATNGRFEAVSVLLCRGADPDIASRSGDTPIHLAAHNGHNECVENLIREHAKCTMLNVSGQNPLDLACQNGHTEVVALLLRSGQFNPQKTETSQTSLKLAAKHGHTHVLSVLIKHGFDVNRVLAGAHGTCLHEAALYGKIEAVHYLLQCGANPTIKNTQGLTALDIVNHYTDPRSAQQLKQLLKDAISKSQMSQNYQQQPMTQPTAASNQRYSYTLPHNATQQQGTSGHPPQGPPGGGSVPQVGYNSATLPHGMGGTASHQGYTQGYHEAPPQVQHANTQPQLNAQAMEHQQRAIMQKQMSLPVSYNPLTGQQHTGIPSMAEMIASKAANRKQMTTSPSKKDYSNDSDVRIRSATMMAGMKRPALSKQRRNSFSEESGQEIPYDRSNPPTLPRRAHPPTFKPVPPPSSPSQEHGNTLSTVQGQQQALPQQQHATPYQQAPPKQQQHAMPYQQASPQQQHATPYQQAPSQQQQPYQHQASPQQHHATSYQQQAPPQSQQPVSSGGGTPSFSDQIAALAAKKLGSSTTPLSVTPSNTPPIERKEATPPPMSLENELLAKLKRRQESVTKPAPDPVSKPTPDPVNKPAETTSNVTETKNSMGSATPPTVPRPTTISQQNVPSAGNTSGPPSPSKTAPKPKPKPPVAKPIPKEEEKPRALTWQEELAKRRSETTPPAKEATPPPTQEKKAPPPTVKSKPKPSSTMIDANRKAKQEQNVEPPKPQPKPQRTVEPKPQPVEPPKPQPVEPPKPHPVEPPKSDPPKPVETSPKPHPVEPPKPHPIETPKPKPQPIELSNPERPKLETKRPTELKEDNPSISKLTEDDRPSTPSSDQMSRSTSHSSIASVPMPSTPGLPHSHPFGSECVPISDWLATYKLTEYLTNLQTSGYDNTDFLIGITMEELIELGVAKAGHRKRILSSLGQLLPKEHYLTFKPTSVAEWLQLLGLSQYESEMIENGYDDIEFITSVTEEELVDIGINKKGHLKRFKRGINELLAMQDQQQNPAAYIPSYPATGGPPQSPTHSTSNLSSISQTNDRGMPNSEPTVTDKQPAIQLRDKSHKPYPSNDVTHQTSVTSSVDSGIESSNIKRQSGNFLKMKQMLAKNLGVGDNGEGGDMGGDQEESDVAPPKNEPVKMRSKGGPPPIPKRANSTIITSNLSLSQHSSGSTISDDKPSQEEKVTTPPQPSEPVNNGTTTSSIQQQPSAPPVTIGSDETDSGTVIDSNNTGLTTEDIDAALDEVKPVPTNISSPAKSGSLIPELDDLDKALQGFTDIGDDLGDIEDDPVINDDDEEMLKKFEEDAKKEMEDEIKTDQMLADIDDMLADLNTHLDIMIPPTS